MAVSIEAVSIMPNVATVGKTITRTITLDTSSPVIASVVINSNPINVGQNYTVTIEVTG